MIALLLAAAATLLAGSAVARAVPAAPRGASYLYGCGVIALAFTLLPWSRWTVGGIAIVAVLALLFLRRQSGRADRNVIRPSPVDLLTTSTLALFAAFSTVTSLWQWDAWAIWALKARIFFEAGAIDWRFLEAPVNGYAHPDYPLLVPANLALPAILGGSWSDRWLGLFGVLVLAAAVLVVRDVTSRRFSATASATIALTVAGLGASSYVGTAETPLLALSLAALACLHARETTTAAILFGLAASTKNEGAALLAAVLLAQGATAAWSTLRRRPHDGWHTLVRLWPAAAIVAPWLVLRALHSLPTDLVAGSAITRLFGRLSNAGPLLRELATGVEKPSLWIAVAIAAAFFWRKAPLLFAVVALHAVFCAGAYFVTPYDVSWHITTSWDRISRQLVALAAYAAQVAMATQFSSLEGTHAEARSEQQRIS